MKTMFVGGALALALSFSANADIIPSLVNVVPTGSAYTWNYMASLTSQESLNPGATNGNTCMNAQCNPPGTFFTIYDFAGFVPQSQSATSLGWAATAQLLGQTPQNIAPIDNPQLMNLVFTYTGAVIAGPMTLGGFSAQSIYSSATTGTFSTQATKSVGDLIGTTDQNFGQVSVPVSPVPEPFYALFLIPVFAAFVAWRGRRNRYS